MTIDWNKLLTKKRFGKEDRNNEEDVFVKDIRRIIYSTPFRRMQGKTQAFVFPEIDHIRNRLTHSLEVANVCQEMVTRFLKKYNGQCAVDEEYHQDFINCAYAAALLHDIGNPPFGHMGEFAIREYFQNLYEKKALDIDEEDMRDFMSFDGNAQGFRIITRLTNWREQGGMRLSYATIAAFIKYPFTTTPTNKILNDLRKYIQRFNEGTENEYFIMKKYGIMKSDIGIFNTIMEACGLPKHEEGIKRHPIVYFVEAADDICYITTDLEDSYRLLIGSSKDNAAINILGKLAGIDPSDIKNDISDPAAQAAYLRSKAIDKLIDYCIEKCQEGNRWVNMLRGNINVSLIEPLENGRGISGVLYEAKQFCENFIYKEKNKLIKEYKGREIIRFLLSFFVEGILFGNGIMSDRIKYILPEEYRYILEENTGGHYATLQTILDYVSGMTDKYALKLYNELR